MSLLCAMNPDLVLVSFSFAVAAGAAVLDVQRHRIPNRLTYPGTISGVVLRAVLMGWKAAISALAVCLLAVGVFPLF